MATANKQVEIKEAPKKETSKAIKPKYTEEELNELVDIFVPVTNKEQGDVYLAVNGKNFIIQPGKHVSVPLYVKLMYEESEKNRLVAIERQRELESK